MGKRNSIAVPYEYRETIYSVCVEVNKMPINISEMNSIEMHYAMGAIMNRLRETNAESCEIEFDWTMHLVNAVYDLYPNGSNEPEEIRQLKDFLFKETGCR